MSTCELRWAVVSPYELWRVMDIVEVVDDSDTKALMEGQQHNVCDHEPRTIYHENPLLHGVRGSQSTILHGVENPQGMHGVTGTIALHR